ncbi:MAG: DUF1559 domain-containing protein [Capsulimonadaceae bacterium]|nr:DUF1559 domain-containing protein [Capsulimonadaceae bacterium]
MFVSITQRRFGFTLIELLVVIAIIAILAAILFPVFATAREKARRSTCLSNEKELGLAFMQYTQDFDETLPSSGFYGYGWAGRIYPYVKSVQVFQCPDDLHTLPANAPAGAAPISYALNTQVGEYHQSGGITPGFPISQFQAPASTVLLFEAQQNGRGYKNSAVLTDPNEGSDYTQQASLMGLGEGAGYVGAGNGNGSASPLPGCSSSNVDAVLDATRHDTITYMTNYVLADGHAKSLVMSVVSDPCNNNIVLPNNLGKFAVTFNF